MDINLQALAQGVNRAIPDLVKIADRFVGACESIAESLATGARIIDELNEEDKADRRASELG